MVQNTSKWGRATAAKRYAEGGEVVALPFSPTKTADALSRLEKAKILNKDAAKDFTASRIKSWGLDPQKYVGRDAKYRKGGPI